MVQKNTNCLFTEADFNVYANLVTITDIDKALQGAKKLKDMYIKGGKTRRLRIKRVVVYTINRINAILKKKNLKKETRSRLKKILEIYKKIKNSL